MGETTVDTRNEIERTRSELGTTISALRARASTVRAQVTRGAAIAGGAVAVSLPLVVAGLVWRRRRGGRLTQAARSLPGATHGAVVPAAQASERWAERRAKRAQQRQRELVDAVAAKIAENQAQAQRRANPLWRRTAAKGLETAAGVGVTALVRRAMAEPAIPQPGSSGPLSGPEKELQGKGGEKASTSPEPTAATH